MSAAEEHRRTPTRMAVGCRARNSFEFNAALVWQKHCFFKGALRKESMLKISIVESPRQCRLVLDGKLIAPWASELRGECAKARQ